MTDEELGRMLRETGIGRRLRPAERGEGADMAENQNEEQEPIRVSTREEFDAAVDELFATGRPIEVPSVEALEKWAVDLEDEGGGIEGL